MARYDSTNTILNANQTWTSGTLNLGSADSITGSVYSDQDGTLYIEQSADGGNNWDISTNYAITGGDGKGIDEKILTPTARIRFVNGGTNQGAFRLSVRASSAGAR